jgi:preprotein translocase subunit YajC
MIRPQMKRQKEAKKFREGLQKGDKVITAGGIYGKIAEVHDTYLFVEIDTNVKIKVDKASVVASPEDIQQPQK